MLTQLDTISTILAKHSDDLAYSITTASKFMGALASSQISSGPYFKTLVANLIPYQMMQPLVDAAFKGRGIDPEVVLGNAGLPAFRLPDPTAPPRPTAHRRPLRTCSRATPRSSPVPLFRPVLRALRRCRQPTPDPAIRCPARA